MGIEFEKKEIGGDTEFIDNTALKPQQAEPLFFRWPLLFGMLSSQFSTSYSTISEKLFLCWGITITPDWVEYSNHRLKPAKSSVSIFILWGISDPLYPQNTAVIEIAWRELCDRSRVLWPGHQVLTPGRQPGMWIIPSGYVNIPLMGSLQSTLWHWCWHADLRWLSFSSKKEFRTLNFGHMGPWI